MADGKVTIDCTLKTDGVKKDVSDIRKELNGVPGEISDIAKKIERELSDISVKNVGKELAESVEEGTEEIRESFSESVDEAQISADQMADAMDDAADRITAESDSMADSVKDDLDDIGDKAKDTGEEVKDGLTGAFKEIFSANIVSDVIMRGLEKPGEIAADVAKQSVEAAAEIKASNAQFEQTFKGVEATAKKSLDNIAKQTGITATRMQESYTSIFAFSKSVGADTEAALDISSRAMIAAADNAAYYDKSIEEATETLQSFLKGNYENDAALGIAATETTRNAKANELYAKSFQELSESQKVDVLLAMVEAGNEASGALGQAAREADSWTNVVGEATEAWRQLMGVLGEPILDNLAPAVQRVTEMLQKMVEASASTELKKGLEDIAESFDNANEQFANTSEEIDFSASKAEFYVEKLVALEEAGLGAASSQEEYANTVAALNALMPGLNLEINKQTGYVNRNKAAILAEVEAMRQRAKFAALEELYTAALKAEAEAAIKLEDARRSLIELEGNEVALKEQLAEKTGQTAEESMELVSAQEKLQQKFLESSDTIPGLTSFFHELGLKIAGVKTEESSLTEEIRANQLEQSNLNSEIEAAAEAQAEYTAEVEKLQEQLGEEAEALGDVADAVEETAVSQQDLIDKYNETREAARESIDSQIGLFQELSLESDTSAEKIVANWQKQQEAFVNYAQNLQKATEMGLDETLVKQLSDGTEESMIYLQALVDGTGTSVEEINAQFQNLSGAKDVAAAAMAGVQEEIDFAVQGVGENITQLVTDAGNGATAALETAAVQIQVGFVQPVEEDVKDLGTAIDETFENSANTLKDNWKDKGQWFESNVKVPINTSIDEMGNKAISTWEEIEAENREAWNRMVRDVADAIDKMQQEINSLQGKTVSVGTNASPSAASYASATEWATPVLASGTVIPTMAVSSAQRSVSAAADNELILDYLERLTSKVEAQDNILEAVLNVTFNGELAQLVRLLHPEIQAEVRRRGTSLAEVHTE